MAMKRMVLEIGMGTDIRGCDSTKAAVRALKDALWRNTLTIAKALDVPTDSMFVHVTIGAPDPETVDKAEVLALLPHGTGKVDVVEGGLKIPHDGNDDCTLIVNAGAVVFLDVD